MKITKQELINQCTWDTYQEEAITKQFVPIFNRELEISFLHEEAEVIEINDVMVTAFNQLLNLSEKQLEEIKEILYDHCIICCETTTYGDYDIDIDWENGQTEAEANLAFFDVANKDDAFEKSQYNPDIVLETPSISIENNGEIFIWFYPKWGDCEIRIVDGKIV